MFHYLHEDYFSTPAERKLVSELHTRGNALELFVLLEVCMSSVVLRRVGVLLRLLCGFQDQAMVSFSWIREWTGVKLCATVKKEILGTSLSPYG